MSEDCCPAVTSFEGICPAADTGNAEPSTIAALNTTDNTSFLLIKFINLHLKLTLRIIRLVRFYFLILFPEFASVKFLFHM